MRVPEFSAEVHATEAAAFDECLWKLERFVRDAGRLPRAAAGDIAAAADAGGNVATGGRRVEAWEAELAEWSGAQRRLALKLAAGRLTTGAMCQARVARLCDVPGWLAGA